MVHVYLNVTKPIQPLVVMVYSLALLTFKVKVFSSSFYFVMVSLSYDSSEWHS